MIEVKWDVVAQRRFKKWCKKHPDLMNRLTERVEMFTADPFDAKLETHALTGNMAGKYAFSINHSYRVVFQFENEEQDSATILNIGTHDEVYG